MNLRQRNEWIEAAKEQVLRNAKVSDRCEAELMLLYDECVNGLETEIRAFYSKFAKGNHLTEAQASALLTGKEYSSWRTSIEGYLKEAEEQGKESKVMLELNTLAAKSQVSRKEQLLANMYRNMANLAGKSEKELTELLEGLVQTNYERKMFDIQAIGGVVWDVSQVDERLLKQILSHPWSGKNYSKALWDNTDQLAALTRRELTLGFMTGAGVDKIAREIDAVMRKGRYAAQRLVRTEASYFANQGQLLAYRDAGIKKYRFLGGGCEICQRLNGQIFSLEDAKAGENLPPIHPNCKCTTVAAYDIPVFKQREGNPLEGNPKFAEWKQKHMEEADRSFEKPKLRGIFSGMKNRKDATELLKPYAKSIKVVGFANPKSYKRAAAEIERQLSKTRMEELERIEVFNGDEFPGKLGSAVRKTLKLSDSLLNNPEYYYMGSVQSWQQRMEQSLGKIRGVLAHEPSESLRKKYSEFLEMKKYVRGNVLYKGKEIECVIQHEMMHIILNDRALRDDRSLIECYNKAMEDGSIYQISYRAAANEREFVAEASVMYENGEPLPDYIKKLIEELKSYGT